ncbi:hypothetical protein JCM10212_000651 [Sporobolomyces blumeae]
MIKRLWLSTLQHTQFVVTSLTVFFILRIRTVHSVYFGAGTLVAAFTAKLLKKCIKQPRPEGAKKYERTYGMPSTHSSSIAFFGVYLSLISVLLPLNPRFTSLIPLYDQHVSRIVATSEPKTSIPGSLATSSPSPSRPLAEHVVRFALASFFVLGSSSVCWSRVRLGHHTRLQVIAGATLGGAIALAWLTAWIGVRGWDDALGTEVVGGQVATFVAALFGGGGGEGGVRFRDLVRTVVLDGLRGPALVWERAGEDVLFAVLEAWKGERGWGSVWDELSRFPRLAWSSATTTSEKGIGEL